MINRRVLSTFFGRLSLQRFMNEQISYEFLCVAKSPRVGASMRSGEETRRLCKSVYIYIYIYGMLVGSELDKDLGLGSYPDIVSLKFTDPP